MSIIDYMALPKGANKKRKRRGRGQGSGHGKTACRGHKGQQARGMTKRTKGFEGGQMPLIRRIPKRGFTAKFKREYQIVNIGNLASCAKEGGVTPESMMKKGAIDTANRPVKVLGAGKLKTKLDVHAHSFSRSAKEAIEAMGGKTILLEK